MLESDEGGNEFIRTLAAVFGMILLVPSVVALVFAIVIAVFGNENAGPVDPDLVAFPLAALSILGGVIGIFLLRWAFRGRKGMGKTISKD